MNEKQSESEKYGDRAHRQRARGRRKERVMHTRISEDLDAALRRAAEDLRVPVSNLVRNLLEDAFDVVETVTESIGGLVDDVVEEAEQFRDRFRDDWRSQATEAVEEARERVRKARQHASDRVQRARRWAEEAREGPRGADVNAAPHRTASDLPEFPGVVGWQPLVLNAAQSCAACGRSLSRGERAHVGISATGRPTSYLCADCAQALS
jgi:hypothetical protein